MSSQTPEDRGTPHPPKSKQERIRDNQRRSRARRQDYLADVERRLSECQITCREADIQRAALLELQIENTRLRELLALAGVNDQFVEQYVSQAVAQLGQYPQESNPALRQIKPKIVPVDTSRSLSSNSLQAPRGQQSESRQHHPLISPASTCIPERALTSTPASSYTSSMNYHIQQADSNSYDWLYQQSPTIARPPLQNGCQPYRCNSQQQQQQPHQEQQEPPQQQHPALDTFHCDTFGVPADKIPRIADESSILCSVAKQMIDQFHLSPAEMESVKAKIFQGFCRPAYPGATCTVDNQILFQVLNDLSIRYS